MAMHSLDRLLLRYFPVPKFLSPPSFGLDLSDESLKFIQLVQTKNSLRVEKYGERNIGSGIIESGEIKDPKKMQGILKSLRDEQGIKSVRVSLPEEQVYLFKLQLAKEGLTSIKESIELSLEEHVPISAEGAVFDYELIGEDDKNIEIQVATMPQKIIDSYLSLFQNTQISVTSFELEAQALARSVIPRGDLDTYMIVDFGGMRTGIFIVSRGIVMFTSTLDVGGVMLNEMIAKNFKVSMSEAEKMKQKYGLQRNVDNKEIFSVLLNSVSILRDEIVKHFTYWQTHKDEKGQNNPSIKKIILCGGDSNLIGLSDYFAVSIKHKVEIADVWVNIIDTNTYIPEIESKQAVTYPTALGLALGNFEHS